MTDRPRQIPSRASHAGASRASARCASASCAARRHAVARSGRGFTLVEMLVVIAVIVLAMTLAIPAIRTLTGSRSIESAENAITSYLGQVRAEAIGQQKIEGVMFLLDVPTDRIMCVPVQQDPLPNDPSGIYYIDVIPNRDPYLLPNGIRLFTTKDSPPPTLPGDTLPPFVDAFLNWRYLGPNSYPVGAPTDPLMTTFPIGVILFGADGKLLTVQYGFRMKNGTVRSPLQELMYNGNPGQGGTLPDWPRPAPGAYRNSYLSSQIGFVLADKETFLSPANGFADHDETRERLVDSWLDTNTSPIIINRYDGTLMRAE